VFANGRKPLYINVDSAPAFTWAMKAGGGQNAIAKLILSANGGRWERSMKVFKPWSRPT